MSQAEISYFVIRTDETQAQGSMASSYIPTLGAPTKAVDTYRTLGIADSNLNDFSFALTDVAAIAALEKIATGPVSSISELQAAETAIAAILLYDQVDVITWGPKVDFEGNIGGRRTDTGTRSQLGFDIGKLAHSHDWLIAPEFVLVRRGRAVESTLSGSSVVGQDVAGLQSLHLDYWNPSIEKAVVHTIAEFGAPTYLADPRLTKAFSRDDFQKRLYSRVNISWEKHVQVVPSCNVMFAFPPMLSILFDRMGSRQDLLAVIQELRDELAPVRAELFRLNQSISRFTEQKDLEASCRRVEEAFSAIVAESRMTNSERTRRSIIRVFKVLKPIYNFFVAFQKGQLSIEEFANLTTQEEKALFTQERIVDRTLTSAAFSDLLDTWNLQQNLRKILTEAEIRSISLSVQN